MVLYDFLGGRRCGECKRRCGDAGEQDCELYVTSHSATDRNIQIGLAKAIIGADP
jgi:hypothetical protein